MANPPQFANALYHNATNVISTASNSARLVAQIYATQPAVNNVYPPGCFYYQLKDPGSSAVEVVAESWVRAITGTTTA